MAARVQIEAFATALENYKRDLGDYPRTTEGLQALVANSGNSSRWAGPYLKGNIPLDPWDNAYLYTYEPGRDAVPRIVSYGADGRPGGTGYAADISYPEPR